jgi:L-alanine-DL-glutamate epimerase-like enolase superfamily enzyme
MISRVEAFPLAGKEPHNRAAERRQPVRIETDDGTLGWGEGISQFPEASLATKARAEVPLRLMHPGRRQRGDVAALHS